MNLNAYVSNPNQWVDPLGLQKQTTNKDLENYEKWLKHWNSRNEPVLRNQQLINQRNREKLQSDNQITQAPILSNNVNKDRSHYQGGMMVNDAIKGWEKRLANDPKLAKFRSCPSGMCNIEVDYLICSGSTYVASGNVAFNLHNGNIYGGGGFTRPGFNKETLKPSIGGSCIAYSLGYLDKDKDRGNLTDSTLNGTSFGAVAGLKGIAVAIDMPASLSYNKDGQNIDLNLDGNFGLGIGTPGVNIYDISKSKLIGNIKDVSKVLEPQSKGLMHMFGYL